MDETTIDTAAERVQEIAANHDVPIDRLIVFDSRVREDYREHSEIDILLVLPAFEDVTYSKRPRPFNKGGTMRSCRQRN